MSGKMVATLQHGPDCWWNHALAHRVCKSDDWWQTRIVGCIWEIVNLRTISPFDSEVAFYVVMSVPTTMHFQPTYKDLLSLNSTVWYNEPRRCLCVLTYLMSYGRTQQYLTWYLENKDTVLLKQTFAIRKKQFFSMDTMHAEHVLNDNMS